MKHEARRDSGFSMIELLIAMVVTLILAGGIFGLMTSGQTSFKREPELADRQQNIRAAMNIVAGDIRNAGFEVPGFMQIFFRLDADGATELNGEGPKGTIELPGDSENSDFLQMVSNDGYCPSLDTCSGGKTSHSTGVSVDTKQNFPPCFVLPNLVLLFNSSQSGIFWGCAPGKGASGACPGGSAADNGHMILPPRVKEYNPPGGPDFLPTGASVIEVVRYEIRLDADGVPNLWRSPTGGSDPGASCKAGTTTGGGGYTLVARGIEDMQVEYMDGQGVWMNSPRDIVEGDYNTIVRQVRVTLSGRTLAKTHLQGESEATPATITGQNVLGAGTAIRGQLTTVIVPRAALLFLEGAQGGPQWR